MLFESAAWTLTFEATIEPGIPILAGVMVFVHVSVPDIFHRPRLRALCATVFQSHAALPQRSESEFRRWKEGGTRGDARPEYVLF